MNIRDIARLAGVTPGTVSKVLNNYPDISTATRQHVLQIIAENQYDPKANVKNAKAAPESTRICLVVEAVYNEVYEWMERNLSKDFHNAGYCIAGFHDNFYIQDKQEKFNELLAYLEWDKISSLLYLGGNYAQLGLQQLGRLPCPTVFINTVLPLGGEGSLYSSLQTNHYPCAQAQMQMLVDAGHRDIATVISSPNDISIYGLRQQAYRTVLTEAGLRHNLDYFLECRYMPDRTYQQLKALLEQHPEITAVCCQADIMLPGVLRAIRDVQRTPGEDVAVVSFDGLETTAYSIPSVTTFAQPYKEMTDYAQQLMIGLLKGDREHQCITFNSKFIQRESF